MVNREFDMCKMKPMKNFNGTIVEKYLPRKCGATSKIIGPKDHCSIQIFIPDVKDGKVTKEGFNVAFSGYIRDKGRCDQELEKILRAKGVYDVEY